MNVEQLIELLKHCDKNAAFAVMDTNGCEYVFSSPIITKQPATVNGPAFYAINIIADTAYPPR